MGDRATPIWPFPNSGEPWWHAYPPHNMPPPRFAVGDRVRTRWGSYTVLSVHDWEYFGGRAYHCRPDGSSAPPSFGHTWGEHDMAPLVEQPAEEEGGEAFQALPSPRPGLEQLELFA